MRIQAVIRYFEQCIIGQMDIIKGNQPGVEWADMKPQQKVDEVLLRRRYRQAEGFKPGPVVYPGGER